MPLEKDPNFPAMKWDPKTGENQIFTAAADVPSGWLDMHPDDPKGKAAKPAKPEKAPAAADALPMKRKAIVAALKAGEIEFAADSDDKALYALLESKLREHLVGNNVDIPEGADVPALLALTTK